MIPDNVIEEIKVRNDIADVIGTYVTLKRAGSNMNGLCPFHNEKTPSFTVFNGTQSFYCFGCGAAGDVVTFIRKIENLDYVEALRFLAKRSGVNIPEEEQSGGVRRTRIYEMNKAAARFFRSQLLSSSEAKEYIVKRGLDKRTVDRFGLGYSGTRGFELINHLKELGYTEDEMVVAKLAGKGERGYYPFFRNRVMFPIIDTAGAILGFGGRVMDNSLPKYLNTPDTPAFNKGRNLFALNYAKDNCKECLILCEGYMDVIAMHAAGFTNAVATLGTALTQEQARLIKRYTSKVILSYDGDRAGKAATDRASKILTEVGIDVRILQVSGAKDPDEYIKAYGADAFARLIKGSETKFDFVLKGVLAKYDVATDDGKIKASKELCSEIATVDSAVERELYIHKTSKELGISRESVEGDVKKALRLKNRERAGAFEKKLQNKALGIGDKINPEHSANPKAVAAEEAILGIMMLYPERTAEIAEGKTELSEDDFVTGFNKRVFSALIKLYSEGKRDVGALGAEFTQEEMNRVYEIQVKRNGLDSQSETVLKDNLYALKNAKAALETDIDKIIKAKLMGS
ncbi:MAG: DNA primase [Clostridia bacterium]|nr:DNA primase [Clostridia bacterium]